jgi:glyoxylase-like metal-dependent hydrolase (beta-lactamase superfamily II)
MILPGFAAEQGHAPISKTWRLSVLVIPPLDGPFGPRRKKLTVDKIELGVTSSFLLRENGTTLLIDSGYDRDFNLLRHSLEVLGTSIELIDFLLITHAHDDHAGCVSQIRTVNPKTRLILSEKGREFIATGKHANFQGAGYINKRISFVLGLKARFDKGWTHSFPAVEVREDDIVVSRDTSFEELGISVSGKVLMTPGHTHDHISVLLNDGRCICGDAAANFLGFLGLKNCVISVNDLDEYYHSWEKFLSHSFISLLPSHGKEFGIQKIAKNIWKNKKEEMVLWKVD